MQRLKTIYKNIFHILYLMRCVSWYRLWKQKNQSASVVVWIQPDWNWRNLKRRILSTELLNDLALLQAVLITRTPFILKIGSRIGTITGKHIIYNISHAFNTFQLSDHSAPIYQTALALEAQGNSLYPSAAEVRYWENKAYMHERFSELDIRTPDTIIFSSLAELNQPISYPVLLKETHAAGSAGVLKISDYSELDREFQKRRATGQNEFLLQELLNIRKDLRVTIVGTEVVLYYWRINKSKEWKPTSTGHGSDVDFVFFPETWKGTILKAFERLNLTTGAFDVTWQNDDLSTEPYILEVSPAFMPNPPIPSKWAGITYAAYKKKIFPIPRYTLDYIDIVFKIKSKVLHVYFEKIFQAK